MNTTALWRWATASSGRAASAFSRVKNKLPGNCAPIIPGSPITRSNSAAAAARSVNGNAANAANRPGCRAQIAASPSFTLRHSGSASSTGCASIQQNEPSTDRTLTATSCRSMRANSTTASLNASASAVSAMRGAFSTSTPSVPRTMRGSRVRARKASATSEGFQCACMSIIMASTPRRASSLLCLCSQLSRRALGLRPAQVLVEPRHDLDEIAGPVAVVELVHENFVPGVLAGAGRTRQAENIGRIGDAGGGARLDRRRADLRKTYHQKQRRERVHLFLEQRFDRLRRDIAAGKAGTAGGDDDIDHRIFDPGFDAGADRLDLVGDDAALGDEMTGGDNALRQHRAGLVILDRACVGNRQHRDLERHEAFGFVNSWHGLRFLKADYGGGRSAANGGGTPRQSELAENVLQAATSPFLKPFENQRLRCSDVP